MDIRFLPHNSHLDNPDRFHETDPHLKALKRLPLVYKSPILDQIPKEMPGIYSLSGGRQIGKTTLAKQWMMELLRQGVTPESIGYVTGELIDDHHTLVRILNDLLAAGSEKAFTYLILDEVTYIKGWDKGIKYLADAGMLEETILVITGSDTGIIKETRMRLPGRRGCSDTVDFHLYPLSFLEYVKLHSRIPQHDIDALIVTGSAYEDGLMDLLFEEFESYLLHGGFLTAINDLALYGKILPATFSIYSDWIRGDVLKRDKREHYLLEILGAIVRRYSSQITWNSLSRDLSIDHPKTVADYVALLGAMDAVFIQAALLESKLTAAPKKARKVMFTDPFILHAVRAWINPCEDPYENQVKKMSQDPVWIGKLAESCVATHYRRYFPTYYIKAKGEVDIAYVRGNAFWPVEVKWTKQMRPKEFSQITKYENGVILNRSRKEGVIRGVATVPLPLAMLRIGTTENPSISG